MAGRGAPTAVGPSGARGRRPGRRRERGRPRALAAPDSFAPAQQATPPAARQRPRPDAENFGGEVSFEPPFTSLDHLFGDGEQCRIHAYPGRLNSVVRKGSRLAIESIVSRPIFHRKYRKVMLSRVKSTIVKPFSSIGFRVS